MKNPLFKAKISFTSGPDYVEYFYSDNPIRCELWLDEQVAALGFSHVKYASIISISTDKSNV